MSISNKIGPPVTGDDFYGRKQELAQAHQLLDSHHSIVLSAPRRIGKSSFAKRLIEEKAAQGWKCVYIDLEGIKTKNEFLHALISKFNKSGIWSEAAKTAGNAVAKLLNNITEIGPVKVDFKSLLEEGDLYQTLAETIDHTKDTLIVIDELTLFLGIIDQDKDSFEEAAFFLNWFRSLRQIENSNIRWVFSGSVGLQNFTAARRLSMTINDLAELHFDALSDAEAKGLVKELAASESLIMSDTVVNSFLEQLAWPIPYFIQLLFSTIKTECHDRSNTTVTDQDIATSFKKLVYSVNLNTWSERLAEYNERELGARMLLKLLSQSTGGITKQQLLNSYMQALNRDNELSADDEMSSILNMLEHDGYIIRASGKRAFRSPLLREWWYYKFVE